LLRATLSGGDLPDLALGGGWRRFAEGALRSPADRLVRLAKQTREHLLLVHLREEGCRCCVASLAKHLPPEREHRGGGHVAVRERARDRELLSEAERCPLRRARCAVLGRFLDDAE